MSLPFPPELWQRLCQFLMTHETCQVVIHQHQGRIWKIDLGVAKETVWSRKAKQGYQDPAPTYDVFPDES